MYIYLNVPPMFYFPPPNLKQCFSQQCFFSQRWNVPSEKYYSHHLGFQIVVVQLFFSENNQFNVISPPPPSCVQM